MGASTTPANVTRVMETCKTTRVPQPHVSVRRPTVPIVGVRSTPLSPWVGNFLSSSSISEFACVYAKRAKM